MNFASAPSAEGSSGAPEAGRILGVVPARLASTRLPDKPLYPLLGRPLVEWVWRRVAPMSLLDRVVVATDSERVAAVCAGLGAPVEMTRADHPSGTDRVAEVARRESFAHHDIVVNIQGDEPLLKEEHLAAAVDMVRSGWDVGTCATQLGDLESRRDPNVVKVVRGAGGRALYFSRAGIPFKRAGKPDAGDLASGSFLRHIGIYAYRRRALLEWVALDPSPLERLEVLEQLRPLEAGLGIGVAVVDAADPGVDTPADAVKMERRMRELGLDTLNEVSGAR